MIIHEVISLSTLTLGSLLRFFFFPLMNPTQHSIIPFYLTSDIQYITKRCRFYLQKLPPESIHFSPFLLPLSP